MEDNQRDKINYRNWSGVHFERLRDSVAFIETSDATGNVSVGTCFHIGEGVFVTARHIVDGRKITQIGFDVSETAQEALTTRRNRNLAARANVSVKSGPFFHNDNTVDVACFATDRRPTSYIRLGGHYDDWLGHHEFVLYRTLVLGYPPIPFSDRPALVASVGEINALVDKYTGGHPHFVISTIARGGFSGAPVLIAYNDNEEDGTGTARTCD